MKSLFDYDLTLDEAKELIKNGANVNKKDPNQWRFNTEGLTPLFYVTNKDIATLLIENGANIKATLNDGSTPLHFASNVEVIKVLVENSADLNQITRAGHTPLDKKYNDNKSAVLLISLGAIAGKIKTYKKYRKYFSDEQQKSFDAFLLLTNADNEFFQMCLSYQESIKNNVKIEIKEINIT